jgi:bla regulator protein BlaR1
MNLSVGFIGIVDALGAALLHFVWQGVLVGVGYALLRRLFDGIAARYRLGLTALAILALCPVATLIYLWPAADVVVGGGATSAFGASVMAAADRAATHWQLREALP